MRFRMARDAVTILGFVAIGLIFAAVVRPECPPDFDCRAYFAIAERPSAASSFTPHHAARILPPLIAHLMVRAGLQVLDAFRVMAVTGYIAIALVTYGSLRTTASPIAATAGVLWLWLAPWPFLYALWDVGQA